MAEDWFMFVMIEMVVGKRENLQALVKRWWKKAGDKGDFWQRSMGGMKNLNGRLSFLII